MRTAMRRRKVEYHHISTEDVLACIEHECKCDQRRIVLMETVLEQLANCNLTENNCADFEVANRRIRALARKGLGR